MHIASNFMNQFSLSICFKDIHICTIVTHQNHCRERNLCKPCASINTFVTSHNSDVTVSTVSIIGCKFASGVLTLTKIIVCNPCCCFRWINNNPACINSCYWGWYECQPGSEIFSSLCNSIICDWYTEALFWTLFGKGTQGHWNTCVVIVRDYKMCVSMCAYMCFVWLNWVCV